MFGVNSYLAKHDAFSAQSRKKARLVEHCTDIAEVMGLNPVQAWIFLQLLNFVYNCDDQSPLHKNFGY